VLSDEPLPGLAPAGSAFADTVRVRLRALPPRLEDVLRHAPEWRSARAEDGAPVFVAHRLPGAYHFRYADGTRFVVDEHGTEVWAWWPEGATLEATATYLLGPVFGWLLRLRGVLALHASVAALDRRAAAFAGPAGMGKSTTAAVLARAGWEVLSDDVAALDEPVGGGFRVRPAYPRVRLWPDAAEALFGGADALPRICEGWEKRHLPLGEVGPRFGGEAPLAAVFLLQDPRPDGAIAIEPVPASEALMALLPHTYAGSMLDVAMRGRELEALARLVAAVPVRRLWPPDTAARMVELAPALAAELAALDTTEE
jgi:hypothetical protein